MNRHSFYKLYEEPSHENGLSCCLKFYYGTSKPKDNNQIIDHIDHCHKHGTLYYQQSHEHQYI